MHCSLPAVDLTDLSQKRQFAPEYSQRAYEEMLEKEFAIGNYLTHEAMQDLCIKSEDRKSMVYLLEELNEAEGWKQETLFQAISIADRYLNHRAKLGKPAPCLISLAVTSLMIAAKIEQHFTPSFKIMNSILADKHSLTVTKPLFMKIERKILQALEFSFSYEYPIVFLERYQRLLSKE